MLWICTLSAPSSHQRSAIFHLHWWKKVRECCAQTSPVPPPPASALSLRGFRATCAMLSENYHCDGREETAVLPHPSSNSTDTSPHSYRARRRRRHLLCLCWKNRQRHRCCFHCSALMFPEFSGVKHSNGSYHIVYVLHLTSALLVLHKPGYLL